MYLLTDLAVVWRIGKTIEPLLFDIVLIDQIALQP